MAPKVVLVGNFTVFFPTLKMNYDASDVSFNEEPQHGFAEYEDLQMNTHNICVVES